jgi:hypothetical protein
VPSSIGAILCNNNSLRSLHIERGVELVECHNNLLTELYVPSSMKRIYCDSNLLRSLHIEQGVGHVECHDNLLTELHVPSSVKTLSCDHGVVDPQEFINSEIEIKIY